MKKFLYVWTEVADYFWGNNSACALATDKETAIDLIIQNFILHRPAEYYHPIDTERYATFYREHLLSMDPQIFEIDSTVGFFFEGSC